MIDNKRLLDIIGDLHAIINGFMLERPEDNDRSNQAYELLIEARRILKSGQIPEYESWQAISVLDDIACLHRYFSKPEYYRLNPFDDLTYKQGARHCEHVLDTFNAIREKIEKQKTHIEAIETKLSEKELAYDELIHALLKTDAGQAYARDNDVANNFLSHVDAIILIQSIQHQLQQYAVIDDLPFGATEPDHEVSKLQRRIAELEIQLNSTRSYYLSFCHICFYFRKYKVAEIQQNISGGVK
ncbi:hypothetical protein LU604_16060 [Erwinia tracheiphila]|nr:hypothetical protein [Erwinia tracheiphila]UIA82137.1 hypothetical protein LU604_16060 [Erwinia tracheiphila]UIA90731.1 hypothetical protein LU632_15615 [Erwinia tracheiphila]